MRIIKIDFSAQLADTFVGYIGEHNETDIHAVPSAAMLNDENITVYKLAFGTGGTVYHSETNTRETVLENGYIESPLWQQLTQNEILEIQIEGFSSGGDLLAKSAMAVGYLLPSAHGTDETAEFTPPTIAEITANTAARHTHDNKAILDQITEVPGPNKVREIWATGTTANYTAEGLDALMANGVLFTYKGNTVVNTRTSGSSFYFSVINWQSISTPRWEFYIVDHYKNITENNISGLPSVFVPKGVNGKTYANDNEITLQAGDISAASGWSPSADTDIATKKYVDDNAGGTQQQADWNQSDNTQPDYIKNKPTIPTFPTATNTGDVIYWDGSAYVAGAITNVIPNADNINF